MYFGKIEQNGRSQTIFKTLFTFNRGIFSTRFKFAVQIFYITYNDYSMHYNIKEVGTLVQDLRIEKELTLKQFAAKVGENFQNINAIEKSRQVPKLERLSKICNKCGYSITINLKPLNK